MHDVTLFVTLFNDDLCEYIALHDISIFQYQYRYLDSITILLNSGILQSTTLNTIKYFPRNYFWSLEISQLQIRKSS